MNGLDEMIFGRYERMFNALKRDVPLVPEGNLYTVKYEDLQGNEIDELGRLYDALGFVKFDDAIPQFNEYLDHNNGYIRNHYEIDEADRKRIRERWHFAFAEYGYPV